MEHMCRKKKLKKIFIQQIEFETVSSTCGNDKSNGLAQLNLI